eukprot:Skav236714  [mRNA]  locus=scaffold2096:45128:56388:+ [translate_table: standard]
MRASGNSTGASGNSGPVATLQRWWQKLLTMLKLFFSTIIVPLDPAKDDKGASKGPSSGPGNVRRINPGVRPRNLPEAQGILTASWNMTPEKDISYKTSEAQRLDSELNSLNSDEESSLVAAESN